jgi:hypothetical protein
VSPFELDQIVPEDREYVAGEMSAFLRAFLADVPCRVVNRGLSPWTSAWAPQRWRWEARRRGYRVIDENDLAGEGLQAVTLVGDRILGPRRFEPIVRDFAGALDLDLLTAWFRDGLFVVASPLPTLHSDIVEAIGDYLTTGT